MQPAHMAFADVKKFRFGAEVEASDGAAGKLEFVVADPSRCTITAAGIHPRLFGKTYAVPMRLIAAGTAESVTVSVPLADIEQAPTSPSGVVLDRSTAVTAGGKRLGRLVQLTIHSETGLLRHLVVESLGREMLVSAPMITAIVAKQIAVDLGSVQPKQLVPYRDDDELRQEALAAIDAYSPLRIDMRGFDVYAIDGVIWLRGHVASDLNRSLVPDQLVGLPGIAEIHNDLISDSAISSAVSMALARDPRTTEARIGVYPRLGEIHLRGNVATPATRQAAEQIAAAVPGVKSVVNELFVNPREPVLHDLAAVTNQEDMVPGGS
jgi:osmotically-inducible protein OsmY